MSSTVLVAVLAVGALATAVIYGTHVFCALVLRPAAARASDASLADLVGHIHHFGDNRLPAFGAVSVLAALLGTIGVVVTGAPVAALAEAGVALAALLGWLAVYLTVSAPLNRRLREAASTHTVPPETRAWQQRWDAVIWPRVALQTIALVGLLLAGLQVSAP
jgi:hypothetical protein